MKEPVALLSVDTPRVVVAHCGSPAVYSINSKAVNYIGPLLLVTSCGWSKFRLRELPVLYSNRIMVGYPEKKRSTKNESYK